jgi:hypothetical protein
LAAKIVNKEGYLFSLRTFAVALLSVLAACSPSRGIRPGDTQVVAQWIESEPTHTKKSFALIVEQFWFLLNQMRTEPRIDSACETVCFLDGNDIGSGTYNVYLYTDNTSETVKRIVALEQSCRIPPGLRIGVAKYKDSAHKDWTYEAVYPRGLKHFEVFYGGGTVSR